MATMATARGGRGGKAGCPYCAAPVKQENLARHLRTVHPSQGDAGALARRVEAEARRDRGRPRSAYKASPLASPAVLVGVVVALVVAAAVGAYIYLPKATPPVDELQLPVGSICYQGEETAMHRHVLLHIIIGDEPITIPPYVGLPSSAGGTGNCVRPLHTHDATGKIHIESRVLRAYTLRDFFEIWAISQPTGAIRFDREHLLQKDVTMHGGTIEVRIGPNGDTPVTTYENTVLIDPQLPQGREEIEGHFFIIYRSIAAP